MLQVGGGLDLSQESLRPHDGPQFGLQHLEGNVAVVLEIVREIDGGHATFAELTQDLVAIGQGRR